MTTRAEAARRFECFGGSVAILAGGPAAVATLSLAEARLRDIHNALSRFLPDSELSRLNRDPRGAVPASPLLLRFAAAVHQAGDLTGGLVDATQIDALEQAGYRWSQVGREPFSLDEALSATPVRRAAGPDPKCRWRLVGANEETGTVTRPPGLRLDSGGLGKGLAADLAARLLGHQASFAVDCGGDLRIGGTHGMPRTVQVADPFGASAIHQFEITRGAAATSGMSRHSWLDAHGRPAHHLLDPRSGRPAYTGVIQATALAPTALEAEIRAKAAVLAGPETGAQWLPHGGALVLEDRSLCVVPATDDALAAA